MYVLRSGNVCRPGNGAMSAVSRRYLSERRRKEPVQDVRRGTDPERDVRSDGLFELRREYVCRCGSRGMREVSRRYDIGCGCFFLYEVRRGQDVRG